MNITQIAVRGEEIVFTLDAPVRQKRLRVSAYPAALGEETEVFSLTLTADGTQFSLPRRLGGRDGRFLCFVTADESGEVAGKKYVENAPAPARREEPYPTPSPRGAVIDDAASAAAAAASGARQLLYRISLGDFLLRFPRGEDALLFRYGGRDYTLRRAAVEAADDALRAAASAGGAATLMLLNAPVWRWETEAGMWETIRHPGFDGEGEAAMFDVVREAGCRYFAAWLSFLAGRWFGASETHGRAVGVIVGCGANAPRRWMNAGERPLADAAAECAAALRLAHQTLAAVWPHARVWLPLDLTPAEAGAWEAGEFLAAVAEIAAREGEIPFHLALRAGAGVDPSAAVAALLRTPAAAGRRAILLEAGGAPLPAGVETAFEE